MGIIADAYVHPLVVGFLVALGVGLLIGIDRERNKGERPTPPGGGRAHLHAGLLAGATAMAVGDEIVARRRRARHGGASPASPTGARATAIPG